ncbi:MAG: type II toxin-antitoxin system VapC family toxin [Candidatus Tectomicrobia bacterium]|uniref:Ribonuclease VapC n=1 Tax=Tectimicrobiota bacterium TaxID=2528274 RepID=A0A932GNR2_UNCTE|nr:type II toxin-antitoxin system VapC family toxin [Candidatus Tectomicrobia bacterium]
MAEILLDSHVIIGWLRGQDPVAEVVSALLESRDVLLWTPVSVAEIFAGARKGEEKQLESLFLVLETLPLSAEIGKKAGDYLRTYSRSHHLELGDALIAATAHAHQVPLWTLNKKHYPMSDVRFFVPSR